VTADRGGGEPNTGEREMVGGMELLLILATLGLMVFWVLMLVDCAVKEPSGSDKIVWVVIIAVANWIGALIYFLVRRPRRIAEWGR
jgi:hypothetical protein